MVSAADGISYWRQVCPGDRQLNWIIHIQSNGWKKDVELLDDEISWVETIGDYTELEQFIFLPGVHLAAFCTVSRSSLPSEEKNLPSLNEMVHSFWVWCKISYPQSLFCWHKGGALKFFLRCLFMNHSQLGIWILGCSGFSSALATAVSAGLESGLDQLSCRNFSIRSAPRLKIRASHAKPKTIQIAARLLYTEI